MDKTPWIERICILRQLFADFLLRKSAEQGAVREGERYGESPN